MQPSALITDNNIGVTSLGTADNALTQLEGTSNDLLTQFQTDLNTHTKQDTEAHGFQVMPLFYVAPPFANGNVQPGVVGTLVAAIPTSAGILFAPCCAVETGPTQNDVVPS